MNLNSCTSSREHTAWSQYVPAHILDSMVTHAKEAFPLECAGMVALDANGRWHLCRESKPQSETEYSLSAHLIMRAHRAGDVRAIYHSHPNGRPYPSRVDKSFMLIEQSPSWPGVAHLIIALNQEGRVDIRAHLWNPHTADFDSVPLEFGGEPIACTS